MVERWADADELAVQVTRNGMVAGRTTLRIPWFLFLTQALAWRGHLRDAIELRDTVPGVYLRGSLPRSRPPRGRTGGARRPGVRLLAGQARLEPLRERAPLVGESAGHREAPSLPGFRRPPSGRWRTPDDSTWAPRLAAAARAYLALARRDTAAAIDAYRVLDWPSPWWCQGPLLDAARLLAATGRPTEAWRILNVPPTTERDIPPRPSDVLWYLERARVAEQLGDQGQGARGVRVCRGCLATRGRRASAVCRGGTCGT